MARGADELNADSYGGGSPTVWRVDPVMLQIQGWRTENLGIEVPADEDVVALPALLAVDAVAAMDGDSVHVIDLMRMLRVFATSAFRLETRQSYATDDEAAAFRNWRECGRVPDAADPLIAGWTGLVRSRVDGGAVMRRVHGPKAEGRNVAASGGPGPCCCPRRVSGRAGAGSVAGTAAWGCGSRWRCCLSVSPD